MDTPNIYPIDARDDYINKETRAMPINALSELIWNGLDADATNIRVLYEEQDIGYRIVITDNGCGFSRKDAEHFFGYLGGSWKKIKGKSSKGRFLHGAQGKGRLKALALGRVVDWTVTYKDNETYKSFTITMLQNDIKNVRISNETISSENKTGVKCIISELNKEYDSLESKNILVEMSEIFATYLKSYGGIDITFPSGKLDVSEAIKASKIQMLEPVFYKDIRYPVELELIEWNKTTKSRIVYLCNEAGLPLSQIDLRVQAPGLNFSAYLKSSLISQLSHEGTLDLGELNNDLRKTLTEVRKSVKDFYRERLAASSMTTVEKWKEEEIYPFKNEPTNQIEKIEREIFDIVAVQVSDLVPDFEESPKKSKKFQLRMLRQAIEKNPEELQIILTEVLDLTDKSRKEFAQLLKDTSLTAIISASKVVTDRMNFLSGLDSLLFSSDEKKLLKERLELHKLLSDNTWIFGEEYALSVNDQSLTEALRQHVKITGSDIAIDAPVLRPDGSVGIIDLMLSRKIPGPREDELDYLVVELKRPSVKIGDDEISQIKKYAYAISKDERFKGAKARWCFWIISNNFDEYGEQEANQTNRPKGVLFQSENVIVWGKTWSEVLIANKQRLKLFQDCLNINIDRGESLQFVKDRYEDIFSARNS